MRRHVPTAAVVAFVGLLGVPSAAPAQGVGLIGTNLSHATVIDSSMQVAVSGGISVDFQGDAASGCAAAGLCDYSGRISWNPGPTAALDLIQVKARGQRVSAWALEIGQPVAGGLPATRAVVDRTLPGGHVATCGDLNAPGASGFFDFTPADTIDLGFLQGDTDIIGTRCAGPTEADLALALPETRIPVDRFARGRETIDLSDTRRFAVHGLAGTVTSTLRLRTGAAQVERASGLGGGGGGPSPVSALELDYKVAEVSGHVPISFGGLADQDLCGPLDSCGMLGNLTLSPVARHGNASIIAVGPRGVSRHDLQVAVGLARGRPRSDIDVSGFIDWTPGAGTTSVSESAGDGSARCSDAVKLSGTDALLSVGHGRVSASYLADPSVPDALRTRCPGPELSDLSSANGLASGSVPIGALRGRLVTLHLTRGASGSGQGYQGTSGADMTIVLRRVHSAQGNEIAVVAGGRWLSDGFHALKLR